jgi:hypothetical protein
VDARTRKLAGWVIVAIGVVIALIGGLADQIGVGGDGAEGVGGKQVAALIVGIVIALGGLALALLGQGESRDETTLTSSESV